jgi:hypothetical protein
VHVGMTWQMFKLPSLSICDKYIAKCLGLSILREFINKTTKSKKAAID